MRSDTEILAKSHVTASLARIGWMSVLSCYLGLNFLWDWLVLISGKLERDSNHRTTISSRPKKWLNKKILPLDLGARFRRPTPMMNKNASWLPISLPDPANPALPARSALPALKRLPSLWHLLILETCESTRSPCLVRSTCAFSIGQIKIIKIERELKKN